MYSQFSITTLVVGLLMPLLATVAVALRLRARRIKKQVLGLDDYAVAFALACAIGMGILAIWGSVDGDIGAPLYTAGTATGVAVSLTDPNEFIFCDMLFYLAGISLVKVAVILLYKRIFVIRTFQIATSIALVVVAAWFCGLLLGYLFSPPRPIAAKWDPVADAKVTNLGAAHQLIIVTSDLIIDLFILCLPLPVIKSLNMSRNRKLLVGGIFWLGAFCVVVSSIRLYYTVQFNRQSQGGNFPFLDSMVGYLLIWSRVEVCTSIISACLPVYGPLATDGRRFMTALQSLLSLRSKSRQSASKVGISALEDVSLEERDLASFRINNLEAENGLYGAKQSRTKLPASLKKGDKTFSFV